METYQTPLLKRKSNINVTVPGSKSITNRALLMAAMAEGTTILSGVLFSDDSRVFVKALQQLGFPVTVDEAKKQVTITGFGGRIPKESAQIYVGSAGTAARFLTAFVAMSPGVYRLDSSEQMKKRPMKELLDALAQLGAKIHYLEERDTFPMEIKGISPTESIGQISLNIDRSSQFLSALLMTAPCNMKKLDIVLTGTRSARSYVEMTEQMMKQFGHPGVEKLSANHYSVSEACYQAQEYQVEPDVSAACYFYAMAAITGSRAVVQHMRRDSLQGDMKFLHLLESMGCSLQWEGEQLYVQGPGEGKLSGIDADMGDFSDQTLTLAAIAPFANSPVRVRNVGHIRGQECDRLFAIEKNMKKMQVPCEVYEDGFEIRPAMPKAALIETFEDHRVAMAFAVTGTAAEGIVIENPSCCRKTFENYFDVLNQVVNA